MAFIYSVPSSLILSFLIRLRRSDTGWRARSQSPSLGPSTTAWRRSNANFEDFRAPPVGHSAPDEIATARAANLSPALVKTYRSMYAEAKEKPGYA